MHTLQVPLSWLEADRVHLEASCTDLFTGPEHSGVVSKLQLYDSIRTGSGATVVCCPKLSSDYLQIVLAPEE